MRTYSVTYNTYVGGLIDMTTKLVTAENFYFEDDYAYFVDDDENIVFAVPNNRQTVVQMVTS